MRISRMRRLAIPLVLLAGAAFGISAKCLENDRLVIGPDGNWHIYGEIHNETDVQGLDIALQGTVFDTNGQPLAASNATMCPSSLSPGTFSVYDIGFLLPPAGPQPASHSVNVTGGKASSEHLPALSGAFSLNVTFNEPSPGDSTRDFYHQVNFAMEESIALRGGVLPKFNYCVAAYDSNGEVVGLLPQRPARAVLKTVRGSDAQSATVIMSSQPGSQLPHSPELMITDAVSVRFFLWRVSTDGTPLTKVAVSDLSPVRIPGPGDPLF